MGQCVLRSLIVIFLPSEKDIRRLATLQLKSIFMEHEDPSKTSSTDGTTTPSQDLLTEKSANGDALAPQTRDMSQERADEFLASVVEKHVGGGSPQGENHNASDSVTHEVPTPSPCDAVQPLENEESQYCSASPCVRNPGRRTTVNQGRWCANADAYETRGHSLEDSHIAGN